jgi:DnaA regulatory inactivator Hda
MKQMVLDLQTAPRYSFDNLISHEGNEQAVSSTRAIYVKGPPPFPPLFLHGPDGSGKTHLMKALYSEIEGRSELNGDNPIYLTFTENLSDTPDIDSLFAETSDAEQSPRAVLLDDIHKLPPSRHLDVWDLFNRSTRFGAPLLLAGRHNVDESFPNNEHLRSRLLSGLVFEVDVPHDNGRLMIMDKMARDRNIRISQDVFRYLLARRSRNIKELEELIDTLDKHSLAGKRRITIPFIKLLEKDAHI